MLLFGKAQHIGLSAIFVWIFEFRQYYETSFFFKNRSKTRVFTQKKVKKNYETSKKCDRVAQKSEITEK